jgi:hypothetical protein
MRATATKSSMATNSNITLSTGMPQASMVHEMGTMRIFGVYISSE